MIKKEKDTNSKNKVDYTGAILLGAMMIALSIVLSVFGGDYPYDGVLRNESGDSIIPIDTLGTQLTDTYRFQIARGAIPGAAPIFLTSNNPVVTVTPETIWKVGGTYPWPNYSTTLSISSTDADDNIAGTGARLLFIDGLDINYAQISEVVILNGTTSVNTTQDFYRINDAIIISAGSSWSNEGEIDILHNGTIVSRISELEGESHQAVYTVPANHTLFTGTFSVSSGKSDEVAVTAWVRPNITGVMFLSSTTYAYQNTWIFENYNEFPFPEKTDFEIRAELTSPAGAGKVTNIMELFLVPNSYLDTLDARIVLQ